MITMRVKLGLGIICFGLLAMNALAENSPKGAPLTLKCKLMARYRGGYGDYYSGMILDSEQQKSFEFTDRTTTSDLDKNPYRDKDYTYSVRIGSEGQVEAHLFVKNPAGKFVGSGVSLQLDDLHNFPKMLALDVSGLNGKEVEMAEDPDVFEGRNIEVDREWYKAVETPDGKTHHWLKVDSVYLLCVR